MSTFRYTPLVLKNHIDMIGVKPYLAKIIGLQFVNIFVFATLFSSVVYSHISLSHYALQACYFIPLLSLTSAIGSWEIELNSGLGEEFLLRSTGFLPIIFSSRLCLVFFETLFPVSAFLLLGLYCGQKLPWFVFLIGLWSAFAILGSAIGFAFGFAGEKSLNNFVNSIAWILGFGPGPFMGLNPKKWQFLFPGAQGLQHEYCAEWLKIAVLVLIALVIFYYSKRPRAKPFFSR